MVLFFIAYYQINFPKQSFHHLIPSDIFSISPLSTVPTLAWCQYALVILSPVTSHLNSSAILSVFCSLKPCLHTFGHTIVLPFVIPAPFFFNLSKTDLSFKTQQNSFLFIDIFWSPIESWLSLGLNESRNNLAYFFVPKEIVNLWRGEITPLRGLYHPLHLSLANRSFSININ